MQTVESNYKLWPRIAQRTAYKILALCLLVAGTAHAGMYRWVDSSGRVHYSDTPPVTYNQSGGVEMNKQGNVVKRTQSEAERRSDAERRAEQQRVQQEQQKQAQLDRALTSTYTTEAEIDLARDRALEHHKLAIHGAQIRAKAVDANMAELRARIGQIQKAGRPVGAGLKDQLAQAAKESDELKRTIQSNEDSMTKVREKYAADKTRFRELVGAR
jgi:hypothetical protein